MSIPYRQTLDMSAILFINDLCYFNFQSETCCVGLSRGAIERTQRNGAAFSVSFILFELISKYIHKSIKQ